MRRTVLIVWVMGLFLMVSALMQAQSNVQPPSQAGYIAFRILGIRLQIFILRKLSRINEDAYDHAVIFGPCTTNE